MGHKWSSANPPPLSSETNVEEEEPPPDDASSEGKARLYLTLLDTKNLSLALSNFESNYGKLHTLIRVGSTFNSTVYTKPVKYCCAKMGGSAPTLPTATPAAAPVSPGGEWQLPAKRFVFAGLSPEDHVATGGVGEINISLLHNNLPPLPALPNNNNNNIAQPMQQQQQEIRWEKATTVGKLTVTVSLVDDFKHQKHVERWIDVQSFCDGTVKVFQGQVLVGLDYVVRPSRVLKAGESINDKYDINCTLGTGLSVVKKATNKENNKECAIKFLAKEIKGQKIPMKAINHEIELLKTLSHPNIVQLWESYESPEIVYMVMELVKGSDLFGVAKTLGALRPGLAGHLIGQIVSAVSYLHSRGVAHRDIKPENIIVDFAANKVKLTDFGSAWEIKDMSGVAGTLKYMAPELLLNMRGACLSTDQSVDIWSIGIVAYVLLCGNHPFDFPCNANNNIIKRILSGKFEFPENIPKPCKEFIRSCLSLDPKKRPSTAELLKHTWMTSSSAPTAVNSFSKKDQERLELESSRNNSRSNSLQSLMELFVIIPTRS